MARILLVSPLIQGQQALSEALKLMGHEVDPVIVGYNAIKKFDPDKYDVVLMDEHPPDMSGRHLAKRLVEHRATRIILMQSYGVIPKALRPDPAHITATVPFGSDGETIERTIQQVMTPE